MDVILNYAVLRPVVPDGASRSTLSSDSDFQRQLAAAASSAEPLAGATIAAQAFVRSGFLRRPEEVPHGPSLIALVARLRSGPLPGREELLSAVRAALGDASPESFAGDLARARDSVVAAYLLPDAPSADTAADLVRIYSLARALLAGSPTGDDLEAMLRGPMALPEAVTRLRPAGSGAPPPSPVVSARDLVDRINTLTERQQRLADTLEAVSLHAEDELLLSELGEQTPLSSLYRVAAVRERTEPASPRAAATTSGKPPMPAGGGEDLTSPLLRAGTRHNVVLSARAVALLPARALETVRGLDLDPASAPLAEMQGRLQQTYEQNAQQLMGLSSTFAALKSVVDIDPSLHFLDPSWNLDPVDAPDLPAPVISTPPTTHANVKPLGVADLLLVRAHIGRYERSEVAAIENVVAHEKHTHTARRLDTSETITTAETESTDLRSQTQTIAESEQGHTTVQAVGPGVGPLAAEGASSFAKAVTDQVTSSSTSRVRRLVTERLVRESEDTVEHVIDNSTGAQSTYGVYQWLDKVYSAQIFSYGSRLLYDIIVPEPAAMFREALARPRSGVALPVKPARFAVRPDVLTLDNWAYYATGHRATGVDAPPPPEIVVTEPFAGRAKDEFAMDSTTNTLTMAEARATRIPKGYRAKRYRATVQASGYDASWVQVLIGSKYFNIGPANGTFTRSGALDGETESLPVGIIVVSDGVGWGASEVAVGIEIVCEATAETMSAWQVKTHGLIASANQRRFQEYEEAIASRDASARAFLQSLPPTRKELIVRTEMKRVALEVLTAQGFAGFGATRPDAMGFPVPDPAATAGLAAYIRFFEQAIEWEHLAYAFYPYFWGAQTSWLSKLLAAESDPKFASFLTSGSARVVLPVRPKYEAAFERFLNTGLTPTTDELLDVGGALWVSLVDELRHEAAADGLETPVGEAWEFRVASDLVRARTDGSMPKWSLSGGKWEDAADPAF